MTVVPFDLTDTKTWAVCKTTLDTLVQRFGKLIKAPRSAWGLAVIWSVIFYSFHSMTIDDRDIFNFMDGILHYDMRNHWPHPPGYPVYIFIGKVIDFFVNTPLKTLFVMSAAGGGLCVFMTYRCARMFFNHSTSLLGAFFVGLYPLFFLNSLKAITDIPGAAGFLVAYYFVVRFVRTGRTKDLYLAAFLTGIHPGIRFHAGVISLVSLICGLILHKKQLHDWFWFFSMFVLGVMTWFVPMVHFSGGIEQWSIVTTGQFMTRVGRPEMSILGSEWTWGFLTGKLENWVMSFFQWGLGVIWQDRTTDANIRLWLTGLGIVVPMLSLLKIERHRKTILVIGFSYFCYLFMLYCFLPPTNARYLVPLIPVIAVLCARTYELIWHKAKPLAGFLVAVHIYVFAFATLPLVYEMNTKPPAPIQAIQYIEDLYGQQAIVMNLDTNTTFFNILFTGRLISSAEYLVPGNQTATDQKFCEYLAKQYNKGLPVFSGHTVDKCPEFIFALEKTFTRDIRIHYKHARMNLYRLIKSDDIF